MSSRLWHQQSDIALQHLIAICGFSKDSNEYKGMHKNEELFSPVLDLIVHAKAQSMRHTKLASF